MNCEEVQIEISAWIDGEVAPYDALPLADHLLGCGTCAAFYARARHLERALIMELAADAAHLIPSLDRVLGPGRGRRAASAAPWRRQRSRLAPWALPLAATVLLAIGGLAIGRQAFRAAPTVTATTSAAPRAATRPMTEDRFVGFTRDLLESDARYRDEMRRVMAVATERRPLESTTEEPAAPSGRSTGDAGEDPSAIRGL